MIFRWLLRRKMRRSILGKYVTPEGIDETFVDPLSEWGCLLALFQYWPIPKNDGRPGKPWPPGSSLVTFADGMSVPEAEVLRGRLQAESIFAGLWKPDLEGPVTQVLVHERDAPRAKEIRDEVAPSAPTSI